VLSGEGKKRGRGQREEAIGEKAPQPSWSGSIRGRVAQKDALTSQVKKGKNVRSAECGKWVMAREKGRIPSAGHVVVVGKDRGGTAAETHGAEQQREGERGKNEHRRRRTVLDCAKNFAIDTAHRGGGSKGSRLGKSPDDVGPKRD